jgi:hypothetical protein
MESRLKYLSVLIFILSIFSSLTYSQPYNFSKNIPLAIQNMMRSGSDINSEYLKGNSEELIQNIIKESRCKNSYAIDGIEAIQMLSALGEDWVNNAWLNLGREIMSYDANENMNEIIFEEWENNAWKNDGKWLKYFDGNNNVTEWLWQTWENGNWVNEMRWMYIYDGNGYETQSTWEQWENGAWVGFMQWNKSYDGNGNCINELQKIWDSGAWADMQRFTYTYDGSNRLIQTLGEMWIGMWMNNSRITDSYDGNGNLSESISENWSFIGNAWENSSKSVYTYNTSNQIAEAVYQSWNGSGWDNEFRDLTEYAGTQATKFTMQNWVASAWANNSLTLYTYNGTNNLIESLIQDWTAGAWVNDERWTYTWGQPTTGIAKENIYADKFSLEQNYPNPFNPSTKIKFNIIEENFVRLEVFNSLGEHVETLIDTRLNKGSYHAIFNSSNLTSGIYFYRLTAGNFIELKKMMLIK